MIGSIPLTKRPILPGYKCVSYPKEGTVHRGYVNI